VRPSLHDNKKRYVCCFQHIAANEREIRLSFVAIALEHYFPFKTHGSRCGCLPHGRIKIYYRIHGFNEYEAQLVL